VKEIVSIQSPRGLIHFEDTLEHFDNGVLRLLGLHREAFEYWLAITEEEEGESLLERLGRAFRRLSPMGRASTLHSGELEPGPGGIAGNLWHTSIADHRDYGVARARDGSVGWLIRWGEDIWRRVTEPPGARQLSGEHLATRPEPSLHSDWRMQKARRQVRELLALVGKPRCRVLEVGSHTDHFRAAVQEAGANYERIGREVGVAMQDQLAARTRRYHAVTLWDFVARVPDPAGLLQEAAQCLKPGGVLGIKTPNIYCPEARLFGPHYHSLRRDHLVYLSVGSLVHMAEDAGLAAVQMSTVSHLLVGFIGKQVTDQLALEGQGSDIIAYFRRTS
jgi:hypothetical protein